MKSNTFPERDRTSWHLNALRGSPLGSPRRAWVRNTLYKENIGDKREFHNISPKR